MTRRHASLPSPLALLLPPLLIFYAISSTSSSPLSSSRLPISNYNIHGVPHRRELAPKIYITLGYWYQFCYRDPFFRAPKGTGGNCSSDSEENILGVCFDKCPGNYTSQGTYIRAKRSPVCLHTCEGYGGKWINCSVYGCASSATSCGQITYRKIVTVLFYVLHFFIPVLPKFYGYADTVGVRAATSVPRMYIPPSSPDVRFILSKYFEKKALIAGLLAAHGTNVSGVWHFIPPHVPPHDRESQLPILLSSISFPLTAAREAARQMTTAATTLPFHSSPSLSSLLPSRLINRIRSAGWARWTGSGGWGGRRPGYAPTDRNYIINLQDIARFGPYGALDVLFAWAHPRCSRDHCARCDIASNPCVQQVDCLYDQCGPVHAEPDGTPCDIPDSSGNTVKGTCQAGQCSYNPTRAAVNEAGKGSIWFPSGYPQTPLAAFSSSIDPSITRSTPIEYLKTVMRVWDSAAAQMQSCGDHNGGCGTAICTIGKLRRRRVCVQPRAYGFIAAPVGTDFDGPNLPLSLSLPTPLLPLSCVKLCRRHALCRMAVTTAAGDCWLKAGFGGYSLKPFYQAYRKV